MVLLNLTEPGEETKSFIIDIPMIIESEYARKSKGFE
jgi:hypothetical protein